MNTTPSKKRTIRDISNTQLPLTPTKTPTKSKKIRIDDTFDVGKPSCVKKLDFGLVTPTKKKPSPSLSTSIYSQAKALFQRGSNLGHSNDYFLTSREKEAKYITDFVTNSIQQKVSNSLYISGPPGTGKTAQVQLILQPYQQKSRIRVVKINCMTLNNPEQIYHEIYCKIMNKLSISFHKRKTLDDFMTLMNDNENQQFDSVIVLLDELDSLITSDQQVLFQLFKMASMNNIPQTKIKLILIGISNTLDLSSKFLPRLVRNNIQLDNLQFLPYNADQIKSIIINRLSNLKQEIFHPGAIQLCCKKSASISGDLRKAFDICYKSIELVERSCQGTDVINKVMIQHVAKICMSAFGNNENQLTNLNLLQKAILCQLFNCQKENISKRSTSTTTLTVNSFYDYYKKQYEMNDLIGSLKHAEFIEILYALESSSCILLTNSNKNGGNSNKNIKLNVSYDDIVKSVENIGILKKILQKPN
ncbi:DNA replication licensing factor, putative [Candida dubliniensis CD36]|uniref:Cell division control protein n=1 Tax=Candida dubliniensis (strain CD36 / ATCC MYA-646 / CBS 7987 / NCPF 3949 / NRRL Y-17841) TaxID=573826 RepID=B9W9L5_CANDC|nr:DNA replication licensing factor, putative [Candida dubliniensis CD36]CAX45500.1 DNA replication licensing factor, putative [Candida dubliniensis CD36]